MTWSIRTELYCPDVYVNYDYIPVNSCAEISSWLKDNVDPSRYRKFTPSNQLATKDGITRIEFLDEEDANLLIIAFNHKYEFTKYVLDQDRLSEPRLTIKRTK